MPDIPTPKDVAESTSQAAEPDKDTAGENPPASDDDTDSNNTGSNDTDSAEAQSRGSDAADDDSDDGADSDSTDWKAQSRKHERRAKDYKQKLDAAEKTIADMKGEKQMSDLKNKVSKDKKVPAELLVGTTEEELAAHADKLLAFRGQEAATGPVVPEAGTGDNEPIEPEAQQALKALGF